MRGKQGKQAKGGMWASGASGPSWASGARGRVRGKNHAPFILLRGEAKASRASRASGAKGANEKNQRSSVGLQVGQVGQAGQEGRFTYFPHKRSKRGKRPKSLSAPVGQPHWTVWNWHYGLILIAYASYCQLHVRFSFCRVACKLHEMRRDFDSLSSARFHAAFSLPPNRPIADEASGKVAFNARGAGEQLMFCDPQWTYQV